MLTRFVDWLIQRAKKTPYIHLDGYMNRWWLVPYNRFFPAVRIHEILRSDLPRRPERPAVDFHDHPWSYVTILLRGSYTEVTPAFDESGIYRGEKRVKYGPGSVLFRRAHHWHYLECADGVVTTLFITGQYRRKWGFLLKNDAKMAYDEYFKTYPKDRK